MNDYTNIEKSFPGLNKEYHFGKLEEKDLAVDPLEQFARWLEEAVRANVSKPNAMILSTATKQGVPSSRVMLLKGFSGKGFVFYSHYSSPKARDLEMNPHASLLFFWPEQERQIRITGQVQKTSLEDSVQYFGSRSNDAKLGTWMSEQSSPIKDRAALDQKLEDIRKKFDGKDISCPSFWGGYVVVPDSFEFWQGREYRLNDRLRYRKDATKWIIERLQP